LFLENTKCNITPEKQSISFFKKSSNKNNISEQSIKEKIETFNFKIGDIIKIIYKNNICLVEILEIYKDLNLYIRIYELFEKV